MHIHAYEASTAVCVCARARAYVCACVYICAISVRLRGRERESELQYDLKANGDQELTADQGRRNYLVMQMGEIRHEWHRRVSKQIRNKIKGVGGGGG